MFRLVPLGKICTNDQRFVELRLTNCLVSDHSCEIMTDKFMKEKIRVTPTHLLKADVTMQMRNTRRPQHFHPNESIQTTRHVKQVGQTI